MLRRSLLLLVAVLCASLASASSHAEPLATLSIDDVIVAEGDTGTVAAVLLAYDCAPPGTTEPGWSAKLAPPSGESAVLVSRWGSAESVLRKPPQKTRSPPGSTTSAALVKPVQPLWIGLVAPIRPAT
jgi:hypothetical protein